MRPGRRWPRPWALATAWLALASAPASAFADREPTVENLRVGYASNSRNNLFKIGTWTPLWVQLKGGEAAFAGTLEVEVPDDTGTPTFFRQPVEVPAGGSARVVTYARPGSRDPNVLVRLRDPDGRQVGPTVDGSNLVRLDPVQPEEALVLTLGKPQGVEQIPSLPGFSNNTSDTGGSELTVARVDPAASASGLPGRWYGYDAADVIVVDTNDRELMEALAVRGQALADWVERGGHLVVAVGANWQSARDSVLGPLLPAVPTGQERLTSLEALDSFANATRPITPVGSPPTLVTKLERLEERGGKVLSVTGNVPLVVRGPHGFGRVTLLSFDVDQKPFSEWPDRAAFWFKAADLRRQGGQAAAGGGGRNARFSQSGESDLSSRLHAALEQFPGVRLVPFGWVAFFIFLYILLIGPGDYLFLKKVVKRMELTWITFPTIVLTVSLLAYVGAYAVKGKDLKVNKVDVLDVDTATGRARGSTFFNLFSPQNRDYGVGVVPLALDAPVEAAATTDDLAQARPPAGTEVLLSWLGVPERGFGGMGGSGRIGFTGNGYVAQPEGGSERLVGVRVPIWSTKALTARWSGPAPLVAESDLIPVGTDRLNGTVTNRLSVPLKDAIVAFGKHVYQVGEIAPGASVRVELTSDRQLAGLIRSQSATYLNGNGGGGEGGRINRANLLLALMFHDSEATASAEPPLPSNPLHYLDLTGQLALDRPMLVGRVERPAARLVLGNTPNAPKIDQTTMVRVLLPLGKAGGDAAR